MPKKSEPKESKDINTITEETMIGDLMSFMTQEFKAMPDVWQKLGESHQREIVYRAELAAKKVVREAVEILASGGEVTAKLTVDQVVFKDGAKVVLKAGFTTQAIHDIADRQGKTCLVVIPESQDIAEQIPDSDKLIDKDQGEFPL